MTTEIEKLRAVYDAAAKAGKDAWDKLAAAIVLDAPVKVGNIVATGGFESEANTKGTYRITSVYAVNWQDLPRYRVRKMRKDGTGWHAHDVNVPGLSSDINHGRYKLVEEAS